MLRERLAQRRRRPVLLVRRQDTSLELDRAESVAVDEVACVRDDLLRCCLASDPLLRAVAVEDVGRERDLRSESSSEELTERPSSRLAHEVPARHLEPRDREPAGGAVVERHPPRLLEDVLEVEGVLAQEVLLDRAELHERRLATLALTDPFEPVVCAHADDAARPAVLDAPRPTQRRFEGDVHLVERDVRYAHASTPTP